jgi:hypothetical protein
MGRDDGAVSKERGRDRLIYAVGFGGLMVSLSFFAMEFLHLGIVDKVISKIATLVG